MKPFHLIAYWVGVAVICLCILPLAALGAILGLVLRPILKLIRKAKG